MSIFGKKKQPNESLQDVNMQFNQLLYRIGGLHYRKAILNKQLGDLNNEITSLLKEGEELSEKAGKLNNRIQEEMKAKIAEGKEKDDKAQDDSKGA